ncbi:MAG: hypothetical protein KatS3mg008_0061 [Acidimicrobiales bacterium]|nr:MAG: hypothetical protein KatS3mg008_0061 [Acidimicrobiales bacterium]
MRRERWVAAVAALAAKPSLWWTALVTGFAHLRWAWWRTAPHLPRPHPDWLRFRLETAYGSTVARPDPEEVTEWLEWCRRWRTVVGSS